MSNNTDSGGQTSALLLVAIVAIIGMLLVFTVASGDSGNGFFEGLRIWFSLN